MKQKLQFSLENLSIPIRGLADPVTVKGLSLSIEFDCSEQAAKAILDAYNALIAPMLGQMAAQASA
jgi:hypothetical protein